MIELKNFSCYYKIKKPKGYGKILNSIDLKVETGEFLVVLGESGCGKTTLLNCCVGQADYFDGDLFIDGEPIENADVRSGRFAFVRQDYALLPNMTVYENMAFPLRNMKTPQDEVDRRVKETAEKLGLSYFLTRRPRQLSGGQQQRVAIGRAIIKNPQYLFFDEPFSNLEPAVRRELCMLVKQLHRELRPTVLFVPHDITEAFNLAERIVVMESGIIAEAGAPDELRENHRSALLCKFFGEEVVEA